MVTTWKFNCHKCGHSYQITHKQLHKDLFLGEKKNGRPHMNQCLRCPSSDTLVGELVGNRK